MRAYWAMQLAELNAAAASGSAVAAVPSDVSAETVLRGEADMAIACGSMIWILTYACGSSLMSGSALTGWNVKTLSAKRGHQWGCLCLKPE